MFEHSDKLPCLASHPRKVLCDRYHRTQDMLACCPLGRVEDAQCSPSMFEQSSTAYLPILQPGSPQQTREGVHCAYAPLYSPMEADVRLLSGSKRSCEGYTSLQDEAEADDTSMVGSLLVQGLGGWLVASCLYSCARA